MAYTPMNMNIPQVLAAMTTVELVTLSLKLHLLHRNDPDRAGYCYCGKATVDCPHFTREWTPDTPHSTEMAFQAVREIVRGRGAFDMLLQPIVVRLRNAGATWEQIGAALGCSKQAARQRYGHDSVATGDAG